MYVSMFIYIGGTLNDIMMSVIAGGLRRYLIENRKSIHIRLYICICVCMYVCMYVWVVEKLYMRLYMHIYIYTYG